MLLNDSQLQVQYFKPGQLPQRRSHLRLLASPLHSPFPSLKSSVAKLFCPHAINQLREPICIKTNQKENRPAFRFHGCAKPWAGTRRDEGRQGRSLPVAVLPYAIFRYFRNRPVGTVLLLKLMLATFSKARIPPKLKYICMFVIMNIYNIHICPSVFNYH